MLGLSAAGATVLLGVSPAVAAAPSAGPVPTFTCAAANGDGTFTYFFGYTLDAGPALAIPIGPDNQFTGSTKNLGQPTQFTPGPHPEAFSVTTTDSSLQWHLDKTQLKAATGSLCSNVAVVAEAPAALVLPLAAAAPFSVWFLTMRRRSRRQRG
jgi:hypothetical protein